MDVKILSKEEDIIKSKELLYSIYVEKLNWLPWEGRNLSNIHIADGVDGKLIEDDFDRSATYFGAFHNGALIGRHRCLLGDEYSIELSRYIDLSTIVQNKEIVEFNRFASTLDELTPTILYSLMNLSIQHQKFSQAIKLTATSSRSVKRLYKSVGIKNLLDFKYETTDEASSSLFIINNTDLILDRIARRCRRTMGKLCTNGV